MPIREGLERVLAEYPTASASKLEDHPLAAFIRHELKETIATASGEAHRFLFKGSHGNGNWARGPWVGIFNPMVTKSAQHGFYPVYLFREDFKGVYLSLNQAMTDAKKSHKAGAKKALRAEARRFRKLLAVGAHPSNEFDIDLAPSRPDNDTAFYEAGNICAVYYAAGAVPEEARLVEDLRWAIRIYDKLAFDWAREHSHSEEEGEEDDAPPGLDYEDATRFRTHKSIERRAGLIKKVKKLKGHLCEVCGIDFETLYGAIGAGYIEAHHLTPLASLKGTRVARDPVKDFAVLCANCHRMIHRSGLVGDILRFRKEHFRG